MAKAIKSKKTVNTKATGPTKKIDKVVMGRIPENEDDFDDLFNLDNTPVIDLSDEVLEVGNLEDLDALLSGDLSDDELEDLRTKSKKLKKEPTSTKKVAKPEKEVKAPKPKVVKVDNRPWVTFTNKQGEKIEGYGSLYYCVSLKGKLHYKLAQDAKIIEDGSE